MKTSKGYSKVTNVISSFLGVPVPVPSTHCKSSINTLP